jgi:hypothetical protein
MRDDDNLKACLETTELRLEETMKESKRHHNNYVELRNQFNNFLEGRINQMFIQLQQSTSE